MIIDVTLITFLTIANNCLNIPSNPSTKSDKGQLHAQNAPTPAVSPESSNLANPQHTFAFVMFTCCAHRGDQY